MCAIEIILSVRISIRVGVKHACAQVYVVTWLFCLLPVTLSNWSDFKISMNFLLCESHEPADLTDGVLVTGNCPHGF